MAYAVPTVSAHGDMPTAASMNKYSDGLNAIYSGLNSGKRYICAATKRQYDTRASDTHNDAMYAQEALSYCVNVHLWRWLFYKGEGALKNIAETEQTPLSNDNPGGTNVFDLDSVDWLNYGGVYEITGVTWAFEDWEP